jgi:hypothetical protein
MTGDQIFCFGLSEPDTGSDAWSKKTHAVAERGGWRINGTKKWLSDAPYTDHVLVFAVTDAESRDAHRGGGGTGRSCYGRVVDLGNGSPVPRWPRLAYWTWCCGYSYWSLTSAVTQGTAASPCCRPRVEARKPHVTATASRATAPPHS